MANQFAGKSYYSITTKAGVELYLEWKKKQIGNKIKEGRFGTINTHLEHWLKFIRKDKKLKEMAITDGDDYYHERTKSKEKGANQTTVENEQSTINAMVKWLHSRELTNIRTIEFEKFGARFSGQIKHGYWRARRKIIRRSDSANWYSKGFV